MDETSCSFQEEPSQCTTNQHGQIEGLVSLNACENDLSDYFDSIKLKSSMKEWKLILNRSGRMDLDEDTIKNFKICSKHRHKLTVGWKGADLTICRYPDHCGECSEMTFIEEKMSVNIYQHYQESVPVGSGICGSCLRRYYLEFRDDPMETERIVKSASDTTLSEKTSKRETGLDFDEASISHSSKQHKCSSPFKLCTTCETSICSECIQNHPTPAHSHISIQDDAGPTVQFKKERQSSANNQEQMVPCKTSSMQRETNTVSPWRSLSREAPREVYQTVKFYLLIQATKVSCVTIHFKHLESSRNIEMTSYPFTSSPFCDDWTQCKYEVPLPQKEITYKYSYLRQSKKYVIMKRDSPYQEETYRRLTITTRPYVTDVFIRGNEDTQIKGRLLHIDIIVLNNLQGRDDVMIALKTAKNILLPDNKLTPSAQFINLVLIWFEKRLAERREGRFRLLLGLLLGHVLFQTQQSPMAHHISMKPSMATDILNIFQTLGGEDKHKLQESLIHIAVPLVKSIGGNWFHALHYFFEALYSSSLIQLKHHMDTEWNEFGDDVVRCLVSKCRVTPIDRSSKKLLIDIIGTLKTTEALISVITEIYIKTGGTKIADIKRAVSKRLKYILDARDNMSDLFHLWATCCKIPSLKDCVRTKIISSLCETKWNSGNIPVIKKLVNDMEIYSTEHDVLKVFQVCIHSGSFGSSELVLTMLQNEALSLMLCNKDVVAHAINAMMSERQAGIFVLFRFSYSINSSSDSGNAQMISTANEEVQNALSNIHLSKLISLLHNQLPKAITEDELTHIMSFVRQKMASVTFTTDKLAHYINQMKIGKDFIDVDSRFLLNVLEHLTHKSQLKNIKPTQIGTDERVLAILMKEIGFWLDIFSSTGKQAHFLLNSEVCANIVSVMIELDTRIKEQKITLGYLRNILDVQDNLTKLASVTICRPQNVQTNWTINLQNATSSLNNFEETIRHLEKMLSIVKHLKDDIQVTAYKNMDKEIKLRREYCDVGKLELYETTRETFWGILSPFLENASKLSSVTGSRLFLNISLDLLVAQSGDTAEKIRFDECIHILSTVCFEHFDNVCKALSAKQLDMQVSKVEAILKGFIDTEMLLQEWNLIEKIRHIQISKNTKDVIASYLKWKQMHVHTKLLQALFEIFEIKDSNDPIRRAIDSLLTTSTTSATQILDLHAAVTKISRFDSIFTPEEWSIVKNLTASKELMHFLKSVAGDDLNHLVDAVGAGSDQMVTGKMVADLIEVQRFTDPLFKKASELKSLEDLIKLIRNRGPVDLPLKMQNCIENCHALQNLCKSITHREERTRETINEANKKGVYIFELASGSQICSLCLNIMVSNETLTQEALNNLRSRALLLSTSRKQTRKEKNQQGGLRDFIDLVDAANDIVDKCERLALYGHFEHREIRFRLTPRESFHDKQEQLQRSLDEWQSILNIQRKKFYYLNYFHSRQLWGLERFFKGEEKKVPESLRLLFKFLHPCINVDSSIRSFYNNNISNTYSLVDRISRLGLALETIMQEYIHSPSKRNFQRIGSTCYTSSESVQKGKIYVAELDTKNLSTVHVMLQLFRSSTNAYPQSHNVVFCHEDTCWEEIHLLLLRCLGAYEHGINDELFCIVDAEKLSTDIQFELVAEVIQIEKSQRSNFCLAIVYKGKPNNWITDHFSSTETHRLTGVSEKDMIHYFQGAWSEVFMITSDEPGLGKTEYAIEYAKKEGKHIQHLPISGSVTKEAIIERLQGMHTSQDLVLHLDVSAMSDPTLLDTLVFELIVTGIVKSGTTMCDLQTPTIFIEVGNTPNDHLQNSLLLCSCFNRINLKWKNFEDYRVSMELNSPEQVVCSYFKALENKTLDKNNLVLSGSGKVEAIRQVECRRLLKALFEFIDISATSFIGVNKFLATAAQELRRLSASPYFSTESVSKMVENYENDVRSTITQALLDIAKEFSAPSVEMSVELAIAERYSAEDPSKASAVYMVERVKKMTKWTDTNRMLILFRYSHTTSPVYRNLDIVPVEIKQLYEFQINEPLKNYNTMESHELHKELECICKNPELAKYHDQEEFLQLKQTYVLTTDNLLKMLLIHMRIKSRIPVIVMGETGCGKTTLIKYLAGVCGIKLATMNIHAGRSEKDIIDFVKENVGIAESYLNSDTELTLQPEVWAFFDEINTCDHLGLLNEIICHHSLLGKFLPDNIVFMAACNPYKLREGEPVTAGLDDKIKSDEQSKLVYRVHPLPETMMTYVWDYGSLSEKHEEMYIKRMVEGTVHDKYRAFFSDLLGKSQKFLRLTEHSAYCVSLRDVDRCKKLALWFRDTMLPAKGLARKAKQIAQQDELQIRALLLALAHCYHSRLANSGKRKEYRRLLASIVTTFMTDILQRPIKVAEQQIEEIIREEQKDLLDTMTLPSGIAKNEALRENIFIIVVCILNRIPIFLVGKPGCSKSLSIQLIRSNLRGSDSENLYLQTLPSVIALSYQCTELSTSEGISKVFQKANDLQQKTGNDADQGNLPLVILDEIGLAEVSEFNPLKVLHSLLEPVAGGTSKIAVVGLSNWALDAAKMNRAIHLSRPVPTEEDLSYTAEAIRDDICNPNTEYRKIHRQKLRRLAKAYHRYQQKQKHKNFHGLRDYYSLVKFIANASDDDQTSAISIIQNGLLRNFGGLRDEMDFIINTFREDVNWDHFLEPHPTVQQLIEENLKDGRARHLMLVTTGDSSLSVLDDLLKDHLLMDNLPREQYVVMLGSHFEDDNSEEYSYRVLSDIILYMEQGYTVILKDLERIYGSLYDMLNQNYATVGRKRYCRIAIGGISNQFCQVHDNFRCIVLVEEDKIPKSDPPFLNRFEKQALRFTDILNRDQRDCVEELKTWVQDFTTLANSSFTKESTFLGFHDDTLPSLVYIHSSELNKDTEEVINVCKEQMIRIACPDGILRASRSKLSKDVQDLQKQFFELPLHDGLRYFLDNLITKGQFLNVIAGATAIQKNRLKLVIYTHSRIYTDIKKEVHDLVNIEIEKLSGFKSVLQLDEQVKKFLFQSQSKMFILQCSTTIDAPHILFAKYRIEHHFREYARKKGSEPTKHVCFIIHFDRNEKKDNRWQFNFLGGWHQVTIDDLERSDPRLKDLLYSSISDVLDLADINLDAMIEDQIPMCFSYINYSHTSREIKSRWEIAQKIKQTEHVRKYLTDFVRESVKRDDHIDGGSSRFNENSWDVNVACDMELLKICDSMVGAMKERLKRAVRIPLAKVIFTIEDLCLWDCLLDCDDNTKQIVNSNMNTLLQFANKQPEPRGPESYFVQSEVLELKYPFFKLIHNKIQKKCESICDGFKSRNRSCEYEDLQGYVMDELTRNIPKTLNESYKIEMRSLSHNLDSYKHDSCTVLSAQLVPTFQPPEKRVETLEMVIKQIFSYDGIATTSDIAEALSQWHTVLHIHSATIRVRLFLLSSYNDLYGNFSANMLEGIKEDIKHPGDTMVTLICKQIIPTESVLEINGGLANWILKASEILAAAGQVSRDPPIFHFLRLCMDLIFQVILPCDLPESQIVEFARLYSEGAPSTDEVYDFVFRFLADLPLREEKKDAFICLYFARCLDAVPETPLLQRILSGLSTENGLREGSGPIIFRILLKFAGEDLCHKIIDKGTFHQSPNLIVLDQTLGKSEPGIDSHLATACCDIIQQLSFHGMDFDEINQMNRATQAIRVIRSAETDSLQLVCAVAYIRVFLQHFCKHVNQHKVKDLSQSLLQEVNTLLTTGESGLAGARTDSVMVYLLKAIRNETSMHHTIQMCKSFKANVSAFKNINWRSDPHPSVLRYSPMKYLEYYEEAETCITSLYDKDASKIAGFIDKAKKKEGYRSSLLAITMNVYYLSRTTKLQTDADRQTAKKILDLVKGMNFNRTFIGLLSCFLLVTEFKHPDLQINNVTTDVNAFTDKASVLCHLASVLISPTAIPTLTRLFHVDASVLDSYLVGIGKIRYASDNPGSKLYQTKSDIPKGYVNNRLYNEDAEKGAMATIRGLSPVVFRILHFIFHGCLLVGLACESQTPTEITQALSLESREDVGSFLKNTIEDDWCTLQYIIGQNSENTSLFLHTIIMKSSKYLCSTDDIFGDSKRRQQYEEYFSNLIDSEICRLPKAIKNFKIACFQHIPSNHEVRIEELDETIDHERNLPRLLRKVHIASFADFKSKFRIQNAKMGTYDMYPFLHLFLQKYKCLKYLKSLVPVLSWSMSVSRICNQRKTRKDADSSYRTMLDDKHFINPDEKSREETAFENFKKAWDNVTDHWEDITGCKPPNEFHPMSIDYSISTCLLHNGDKSSQIYQIIRVLVDAQNRFLQETLDISILKPKCQALTFLSSTNTKESIPSVQVNDNTLDKVICFEESDMDFIAHLCDVNTEYGGGEEIRYDCSAIEKQLANTLLQNKAILEVSSLFDEFTYKGELFHACSTILNDISDKIGRAELSPNLLNVLRKKHDRTGYALEALENLEIILVLMRGSEEVFGMNPENKLIDFINDQWSYLLPKRITDGEFLPEMPADNDYVQLQHIVSLYEEIEVMLSNKILESIPVTYRKDLPTTTAGHLREGFKKTKDVDGLKKAQKVLLRFVYRYLRSDATVEAKGKLIELMRSVDDTKDLSYVEKFLGKQEVKVANVVKLLELIEDIIKEMEKAEDKLKTDTKLRSIKRKDGRRQNMFNY